MAIEDEPRQKIMVELRRRCFDAPWGLPSEGSLRRSARLVAAIDLRALQAVLSPRRMRSSASPATSTSTKSPRSSASLFGSWARQSRAANSRPPPAARRGITFTHDSTQTHIGIAYDSVPYRDPDYYAAWAAVSVLSGGMSSRLFTEVRERRGLCYSVHASLSSLRDEARVFCYAGTTAERAQETLDVTVSELKRLGTGNRRG